VAASTAKFHLGGFGAPTVVDEDDEDEKPSGGMPAIVAEFIEANGVGPLRVIVRGPPLSFADELAAGPSANTPSRLSRCNDIPSRCELGLSE